MEYTDKKIAITEEWASRWRKDSPRRGAKVVITGRNLDKLTSAAEGNASLTPFQCDVSKDEDMIKLRDAMEKDGGIDMLINNAGEAIARTTARPTSIKDITIVPPTVRLREIV